MPNELWTSADLVIYLDLPMHELKQNVLARYRTKKAAKEFSHWQATRINNVKNFSQIKLQDRALKNDIIRIKSLLSSNARFIELGNRDEIETKLSIL